MKILFDCNCTPIELVRLKMEWKTNLRSWSNKLWEKYTEKVEAQLAYLKMDQAVILVTAVSAS